jgi:hypothetical protein
LLSDKSSFLVRSLPEEDTSSRRVKSLDMSVVLDQSNNDSTGLFLPPETPPQQRLAVTEASPLRLITPNISGSEEFPQPQFPQPQIPVMANGKRNFIKFKFLIFFSRHSCLHLLHSMSKLNKLNQ